MVFLPTIIFSLILVFLSLLGLSISYFLTGKSKVSTRGCGWNPKDKSCTICGKKTKDC